MPQTAPLNVFQRVIRQWERVHPYNAVQVMKLSGSADITRLREAWAQALRTLGLGAVHVNGWRYAFGAPADAPMLATPAVSLQEHVTAEINRPFADGELPFRPFALPAGDDAHYAGIVYRHWVADSVSIQILMSQWFELMQNPARAARRRVRLPQHGYWQHLGPVRARWRLTRWLCDMPDTVWRLAHTRRLQTRGSQDHRIRFLVRTAPPGWIERVRHRARAGGFTVSDLFLAAIALTSPPRLPLQDRPGRTDIGLGAIVDLRPLSSDDLRECFGLFLGFSHVTCASHDLDHPKRLLQQVARQTRRNKQCATAAAGQIWLAFGLTARLFRPVSKFYQYYRKYMPMCAGLSNVNLNTAWPADYHPQPLMQYLRISPTGPMVPVVFTTTTLGDQLNLVMAYREALVPPSVAEAMADEFFAAIEQLLAEGCPSGRSRQR
jgi:hypothetical protein